MGVFQKVVDFVPNFVRASMYFGHQLGDTVLPNIASKTGLSPVASQLVALPFTATIGAAAMWFGATNVITPLLGIPLSIIAPMALPMFVLPAMLFGGMLAAGIGMGDAVLKKFGKTPVFDGVYERQAYIRERKIKLADKATAAKVKQQEEALSLAAEQQRQLAAQPKQEDDGTPKVGKRFAGFAPDGDDDSNSDQPSKVGARNAAASFNGSSDRPVPKFAGFAPTTESPAADTQQGPRERPVRPEKPT